MSSPPKDDDVSESETDADRRAPQRTRLQMLRRLYSMADPNHHLHADIPVPARSHMVLPADAIRLVMQGHRYFSPQLVHQNLLHADNGIAPVMLQFYQEFLNDQQIEVVRHDLVSYAALASGDVFGLDPNRYPFVRDGHVIRFDNPYGNPVFIFPSNVDNDEIPAAKLAVGFDALSDPPRLDYVLDDAGLRLWGYTVEEFDAMQRADARRRQSRARNDPPEMTFFMSLFSPRSASVIALLNFCASFFHAKHATFEIEVLRRDGATVSATFLYWYHL